MKKNAWGPTPSSHMRHPGDPLLWRSARESLNKLEDRGEGGRVLNQQVSILKLFLE